MWVGVVAVHPDETYAGRLVNEPQVLTELGYGDSIHFAASNVIAIEYSPNELGHDPSAPAAVEDRIVVDDEPPMWVFFAQPSGSDDQICFAGIDHQPPRGRRMITLGELSDRCLSPGSTSVTLRWTRLSLPRRQHPAAPAPIDRKPA